MGSVWQQLLLLGFPAQKWQQGSVLFKTAFGPLRAWYAGSLLARYAPLLSVVLVGSTLAIAPFASTTGIGVLLLACAGLWGLFALADPAEPGLTPVRLLVLLYWAIATVATALSPVPEAALSGWIKLSLYLFFFFFCDRILRWPRVRDWAIGIYLHVALWVSAYGLRQSYFNVEASATWTDPTSASAGVTRVYSYLGNPNLLGGYLLPAICLSAAALFYWRRPGPKVLAAVMFLTNTACLVLTYSRGAWLGFVAAGFVFALLMADWWSLKLPKSWRRWAVPGLLGAMVAMVVLAVLVVEPIRDRAASIFAGREDSSNNFRLNVWAAATEMVADRPWLGIGPGNDAFNKIYPLYMRPRFSALSAYSVPLEIAIETGFIGLAAFVWLLAVVVFGAWRQLRALRDRRDRSGYWLLGAIAILAGMMGHGLVDTVWYRPQVNMLWWFAVGAIASFLPASASPNDPPSAEQEAVVLDEPKALE